MTTTLTDEQIQQRAKRRVEQKIGFYIRALVFVCVNTGLFLVNWYHGGTRWHVWPLGWWGLGLAIHGLVTLFALRGDGLRQRWVADEAQRLRARG